VHWKRKSGLKTDLRPANWRRRRETKLSWPPKLIKKPGGDELLSRHEAIKGIDFARGTKRSFAPEPGTPNISAKRQQIGIKPRRER